MLDPMRGAPDIFPVFGELVRCIDMQERWAAACLYLHATGDDEAAYEAMNQSDRWRDLAAKIEEFVEEFRQRDD